MGRRLSFRAAVAAAFLAAEFLAGIGITPVQAQVTSGTLPASTAPPARRPVPVSAGMEWLPKTTAADNYIEAPAETTVSLPYTLAAEQGTTFSEVSHTWQPSGALSGKVVYLMAGHGWTYNDEKQVWYTQRQPNYGMVEDFGNLDQMHIFAHLVWNTGGTVVPLRPVDHQPHERVIDNTMTQATFYGPWAPSASDRYYAPPGTVHHGTPYMFTPANLEETAVARFRPHIPEQGHYPVYVWARDGADRVHQLYRVAHSGGVTEVRIDHRLVGKGWVWLGTFPFDAGDAGYVEVSNQVMDPYDAGGNKVVVADAVRFGNGMGNARREAGISTYLREDEGDAYWIADSLGVTADPRLYTVGRTDGAATVSSPPKAVAYMNRETEGNYFDRVLISFHSNASTGRSRAAVGLFNASSQQRPDHQVLLARLTARQLNEDLGTSSPVPGHTWGKRTRHTYNGINFGELRRDYLQNEVCATIVETAFHDNPEDVVFLLHPQGRYAMARSTLRGLLKWFDALESPRHVGGMPPSRPENVRAVPAGSNTTVEISWNPGPADRIAGDPAVDYRVLLSPNGRAFDGGVLTGGETKLTLAAAETTQSLFARVIAMNAGGESLFSATVATRWDLEPDAGNKVGETAEGESTGPVLIVDDTRPFDPVRNSVSEKHVVDPGSDPGWSVGRVRLIPELRSEEIVKAAEALTTGSITFATAAASAVAKGEINLAPYRVIVWIGEEDGETDEKPAARLKESPPLHKWVQGGGRVIYLPRIESEQVLERVLERNGGV